MMESGGTTVDTAVLLAILVAVISFGLLVFLASSPAWRLRGLTASIATAFAATVIAPVAVIVVNEELTSNAAWGGLVFVSALPTYVLLLPIVGVSYGVDAERNHLVFRPITSFIPLACAGLFFVGIIPSELTDVVPGRDDIGLLPPYIRGWSAGLALTSSLYTAAIAGPTRESLLMPLTPWRWSLRVLTAMDALLLIAIIVTEALAPPASEDPESEHPLAITAGLLAAAFVPMAALLIVRSAWRFIRRFIWRPVPLQKQLEEAYRFLEFAPLRARHRFAILIRKLERSAAKGTPEYAILGQCYQGRALATIALRGDSASAVQDAVAVLEAEVVQDLDRAATMMFLRPDATRFWAGHYVASEDDSPTALDAYNRYLSLPEKEQTDAVVAAVRTAYGRALFKQADYEGASRLLSAIKNPSEDVLFILGRCASLLGRFDEAVTQFNNLISRKGGGDVQTLFYLGCALGNSERYEESARALEACVSLNPGWAEGEFALGIALLALERPEEAIEHLERARLDPEMSESAAKAIVAAACMLENSERAEQLLRELSEEDETRAEAQRGLAVLASRRGDHVEAAGLYSSVGEHLAAGVAWQHAGRHEDALRELESARQDGRDLDAVQSGLIRSLVSVGRTSEACSYSEELLHRHPGDAEVKQTRAFLKTIEANELFTKGDLDSAINLWEEAITVNQDIAVLKTLAMGYRMRGHRHILDDPEHAVDDLAKAAVYGDAEPYLTGLAALASGRPADAIDQLQAADRSPSVRYHLALAHLRAGDPQNAAAEARQLLSEHTDMSQGASRVLAAALAESDALSEAIQVLQDGHIQERVQSE